MKSTVTRTKTGLYILLAVLTVFFACVSFRYYTYDLGSRLDPQVERAIIQASRLLPQLEENEGALREISSGLERSRQRIFRANEDLPEDQSDGDEESVENVIAKTISWMNRIIMLRVGRRGHVIVVSKDDLSILAHSDERFIGEKLHLVGASLDMADIPDLRELNGKIRKKDLLDDFYLFFPDSFLEKDPESGRFYAAVDAGAYGSVFSYEDTYIICGVTLSETLTFVVVRCFFSTLFFLAIAWIFVRYVGFAYLWHKEEQKAFRRKLVSYAFISVIIFFCVIWYYQTMMDVTGDIATMNEHAEAAVETLNTYQQYRSDLEGWLDEQYLEQCRIAAELVLNKGKDNLTREDMAEFAEELDVEYVYVFDKSGRVLVTNSPYDHFELSTNKEDPSYAFRMLLDGKDYIIQDAQKDEFGEKKQYIGVSIREGNDLCDGFVQIAVNPQLRERLLDSINVQTVIDNLVIGIPDYALAIDKNTMQIAATTGLGYENANVEDLGLNAEELKNGDDGVLIIDDKTYYTGVSESEGLYLMPLVRSTDNSNALIISCILTLLDIGAYFFLVIAALRGYGKVDSVTEDEAQDAPQAVDADNETDNQWDIWEDLFKTEKKNGFDNRWKKQSGVPLHEQTPERRTWSIIYRLLLIIAAAFLILETSLLYAGRVRGVSLDGFAYVLHGNWEKGVNLFSFSYCLFLICVLYVFQELLNQVLYRIARISNLRSETVLLLLRSALKYTCALVFLYIGLAKFGIDTRALWASAGILSLMVGFGAKDLIGDLIAGLFIIFEGTYKIGDRVTVGNWFGTVEEIGLRYTKIGHYADTKIFNNSSVKDLVKSEGKMEKATVKVPIPYETDLLEIEKLLDRELPVISQNIPALAKPLKYQGINSLEDSCVMLRFSFFCDVGMRTSASRDVLREIKLLFDRKHINMPYNHVVVSDYRDEVNTYVDDAQADSAEEDKSGQLS